MIGVQTLDQLLQFGAVSQHCSGEVRPETGGIVVRTIDTEPGNVIG